jgi:cellulose synthase/poly-beta-1,6-N-acetylglucosamine synthase-like glycosyltransferase
MSAPPQRPLTPLSNDALESMVPRLRGRSPIPADEVHLSVLIPVYNEENTIRVIIDQVRSVPIRLEVVCVNDCSTDGSREILDRLHGAGLIDVLVHKERNEEPRSARRPAQHQTS